MKFLIAGISTAFAVASLHAQQPVFHTAAARLQATTSAHADAAARERHSTPRTETRLGENRPVPAFVTPIHTQANDPEGGAYGTWAAGADYKVSFDDGATFIPYLGGQYPKNQPFRWRTTAVNVGDQQLMTRETPHGERVSDTRYTFDHGRVVEAYDVLLEGLEQTFVIASRPNSVGDLVVRGKVETDLRAEPVVASHRAIHFIDDEGVSILSYGAATAVDALGRSVDMTTSYAEGEFELRLDRDWLAGATFPITVDPLMASNTTLNTWSMSFGNPREFDVLREDERTTENVWICFARETSFQDRDLWIYRTNDDLPGSLFVLSYSDITGSWSNESCALASAKSRVICAFERDFGTTRNVRWHTHHIDDLAFRTGFGSFLASNNNWRVDIGGDMGFSGSDRAMVVFQHELGSTFSNGSTSQIRGFYIDLAGTTTTVGQGVAASPVDILASPNSDAERPSINQQAAFGDDWCVAFQLISIIDISWRGYVEFYDEFGNSSGLPDLLPSTGEHKLGLEVAGSDGRYLVCWASADPATIGVTQGRVGDKLYSLRVDYSISTNTVSFPHPAEVYLASSTPNVWQQEVSAVAYDSNSRSHWLVASRSRDILWIDMMGFRGKTTEFDLLYGGNNTNIVEYSAAASFNDDDGSFVVVGAASQAGSSPIFGNIWQNPAPVAPTLSGTSCSSATPTWTSLALFPGATQRIGYEWGRFGVSFAPPGAPVVMALSFASTNVSLSGIAGFGLGCSLLVDTGANFVGTVGGTANSFGSTSWPLPLIEALNPGPLYLQAFLLNGSFTELQSSRLLTVPLTN